MPSARTRRRGSRSTPLDREVIVTAALQLSRVPEPGALSFRRLGQELGVDPTAVYRHFRDKDELVDAALDRLLQDVSTRLTAGLGWRGRLQEAATLYMDTVASHPGIGTEVAHRTTGGPGEADAMELVLGSLAEAGLGGDGLIRHYALYSTYVLSCAAALAAHRLHAGTDESPDLGPWASPPAQLDPAAYPQLDRLQGRIAALTTREVTLTGLELVLDAVERAAARP